MGAVSYRTPRVALPVVLIAFALVASLLSTPGSAATRRVVSGWIPYWSTDAALASFTANADLFSDISPFWHALTGDSTVSDQESSADRTRVIAAARAAGVPVVPAITDGTGTGRLAAALADPARRAAVVATMVRLVDSRGYDGLDLDLEGFAFSDPKSTWATTRPNWVQFVADLGAQLRARGKRLYATVPATYDSNRSATSGYWVYDYAGMAPHVDRIRIMAYDYSVGSPGPIAPYSWVQRIVDYAQTQVPPAKLVLGVAAYGRNWPTTTTGTCPAGTVVQRSSVTSTAAWQLAAAKGVPVQWDATARERTFTYTDTFSDPTTSCAVTRKVYFSDGTAISERARLAYGKQWAGVAIWSVGGEDRTTWPALRSVANPNPFGQLDSVTAAGPGRVRITGWAADPNTPAGPITVRITVNGTTTTTTTGKARPDVAAAYPGYGTTLGYDTTLNAPAGPATVCATAINTGPGTSDTPLGCRTTTIATANPFGQLDSVTAAGPGRVRITGWAADPNTPNGPIAVHLYVNGGGTAITTGTARPDVAAAYPGYGTTLGYDTTLNAPAGPATVCAYAINTGPGDTNTPLGCRTTTIATANPFGQLDSVTAAGPGRVRITGWAADPNTPAGPITVRITVNGTTTTTTTGKARPDVAAAYPGYGTTLGYDTTLNAPAGPVTVCATAINTGPGTSDTPLGCRTTTIATANPFGQLDSVTAAGPGQVRITGWAADPNTPNGPIAVHLYVNGGGTAITTGTARPDVAAAYPGYGTTLGYDTTLNAPAGPATVCAYAINTGPGDTNTPLGCRTTTIP